MSRAKEFLESIPKLVYASLLLFILSIVIIGGNFILVPLSWVLDFELNPQITIIFFITAISINLLAVLFCIISFFFKKRNIIVTVIIMMMNFAVPGVLLIIFWVVFTLIFG